MRDYFSLVTFSHTVFALPFALVGFTLAVLQPAYPFAWPDLLFVVGCMVFARNAAMAFNRLADADFDALNARTAVRDIPAGRISRRRAGAFVAVNAVLFSICAFALNSTCGWLSPVALLVVLGYTYTKRFTWLCHLVLGLGLALAPVGAYMAVTAGTTWAVVALGLTVLFWVAGFDVLYALQDRGFDVSQGLRSIPTRFGESRSFLLSRGLHVSSAACLALSLYLVAERYPEATLGIAVAYVSFVAALVYQQSLVAPGDLSRIDRAFFTTNGIVSVVFASVLIGSLTLLS